MSKINFPKKQEQRLIPKYLLEYATELQENHPDPSESWGGSGSTYTAGDGIDIENNVISVDNTVAMKTDIPDVSDFVTSTELSTELADYELKSEAFSGSYNDLSNKPDLSVYELKTDAFTGNYNDLTNKPDLSVYELKTDAFSGSYNDLTDKPTLFSGDYDDLTNKPDLSIYAESANLATVATTGDYDDLTNKPTIPTVPTNVSAFTNDAGYITSSAIPTNYVTTNTAQNITGEKTFVGDKRIKFKQSTSTNKLGFTLYNTSNQEKGYLEYNPANNGLYLGRWGSTAVNELGFLSEIGSGARYTHKFLVPNVTLTAARTDYIPISVNNTRADSTGNISIAIPDVSNYYTKTEVNNLIPTVPTNVSAFTNDAGYITGITDTMINTALGYTAADAADVPTTATSTSTVTPSTSAFVTGTTTTTETLTFTYTDNTTANITIVTGVTDSTSNAMTGATVSTTTTLS